MLKRLVLNNFKKHTHLEVDFTAGLNGIVGANYRGKSTILQGVVYCLGGSRMVPGKRIATRGTESGFKTVLWFSIPGKGDFVVQRTKTSANLHKEVDGSAELVASGTSPVNQAIADLLGMNLRRFAQIKYARQKGADALLRFSSNELFQIVTELTGLDRIQKVLVLLENDLKVMRHIVETLPQIDVAEKKAGLAVMRQQLEERRQAWQASEAAKLQLQQELASCEGKAQALRPEVTRLFGLERDVKHASSLLNSCSERAGAVSLRLAQVRAEVAVQIGNGQIADEVDAAVQSLGDLRAKERASRQLATEVRMLADEVAAQGREAARLQAAKAAADEALAGWERPDMGLLSEQKAKLSELMQVEIPEAKHAVDHAAAALNDGVCKSCSRPFESFDPAQAEAKLAHCKSELNNLLGQAKELQLAVAEAEELAKGLEGAKTAAERAERHLRDYLDSGRRCREALALKSVELTQHESADALAAEVVKTEERVAKLSKLANDLKNLISEERVATSDLDIARKKFDDASTALLTTLDRLGAKDSAEVNDWLQKVEGEIAHLKVAARKAGDDEAEAGRGLQALEVTVQVREREISMAEEQNAKTDEARRKVAKAERLQGMLRSNRDRYSRQVWDVFMASASMFASQVTGGRIESIARGEDGAFTFMEDGFEMTLDEGSGAQLAIIGIAVQLALAEAAQCPLNILLMDEPTADMDAEHALAFSTLLAGSGKQVVMVTHREMDSSVFDNTISL